MTPSSIERSVEQVQVAGHVRGGKGGAHVSAFYACREVLRPVSHAGARAAVMRVYRYADCFKPKPLPVLSRELEWIAQHVPPCGRTCTDLNQSSGPQLENGCFRHALFHGG